MKKDALRGAEKYTKEHQRKKRWYRVVTCLACVVVFCTVYALILPAITLEKGACEIPEHTHSEACYTQVTSTRTEPVCTIESLNLHQHDDTCYDSEGNLTCGYADFVVHRHDSSCYDEDENLWCPLPEIETHEHTDSCYAVPETGEPELICDKTEVILHEHTSDCFDDAGNLICGKIQVLEHQHTDACFETVEEPVDADTLTCTLPEDENHTHGPLCYGNWELTCGMEEHTHSEECQGTEEALEQGNLNMLPLNIGSAADPLTKYAMVGTETLTGDVLTADGKTYTVTVTYGADAKIPEGSTLSVTDIENGTQAYDDARNAVLADKKEKNESVDIDNFNLAALDISIIDPDGNEIEPEAAVTVDIKIKSLPEVEDLDEIKESLEIQHHIEVPNGVVVEKVFDGSVEGSYKMDTDENIAKVGTVVDPNSVSDRDFQIEGKTVNESEVYFDEIGGINTSFETPAFSTFTITWSGGSATNTTTKLKVKWETSGKERKRIATVHYVDTNGNPISRPAGIGVTTTVSTQSDTTTVIIANSLLGNGISGYTYQGAHYNSYTGDVITSVVGSHSKEGNCLIYYNENTQVGWVENDKSNIYLVYSGTTTQPHSTIHYGYMDGDTFVEFSEDELPVTPVEINSSGDTHFAYLIYDFDGYHYADETYYHTNATNTPRTGGTQTQPLLRWTGSGQKWTYTNSDDLHTYHNYNNQSDVANGSHLYVIYEKDDAIAQGGTPKVRPVNPNEEPEAPKLTKNSVNNGDGTNTISLDITGSTTKLEVEKLADVIVVFDVSTSMNRNLDGTGYNGSGEYNINGTNRIANAGRAIESLAESLLAKKNSKDDPLVRMALIPFSMTASIHSFNGNSFTSDIDEFKTAVEGLQMSAGTNWEDALMKANQLAIDSERATFVIFVTDGEPSMRVSRGNYTDAEIGRENGDAAQYLAQTNHYGGLNSGNTKNYELAVPAAAAIVNANKNLYTIGVSSDVSTLTQLTKDSGAGADHSKTATDEDALVQAFNDIEASILALLGAGNVQITDGITSLSNLEAKVLETVDPNSFKYYRYGGWKTTTVDGEEVKTKDKYGADYENKTEWTTRDADGCAAATYDEASGSVQWNMGTNYQLEEDVTYVLEFKVWPSQAAYDLIANLNNGTKEYRVKSGESDIKGLTQEEYDQVVYDAAMDSYSLKTNTDEVGAEYTLCTKTGATVSYEDGATAKRVKYIKGKLEPMALDSDEISVYKDWIDSINSRNRAEYVEFYLLADGNYYQKDGTFATTTDNAELLTTYEYREGGVTLPNGSKKTISPEDNWRASEYIAPGLATISGTKVTAIEDGHSYSLEEKGGYKWRDEDGDGVYENVYQHYSMDFTSMTVRPMVIYHDDVRTVYYFVQIDDDHPAVGTTYTITSTDGSTANYYLASENATIVAENKKTPELDITKAISDNSKTDKTPEELSEETFTYEVKLTSPADGVVSGIKYWIYTPWTEADATIGSGYTLPEYDGENSAYAPYGYTTSTKYIGNNNDEGISIGDQFVDGKESKTCTIEVTITRSQIIRFTNLPVGTQYTIVEKAANGSSLAEEGYTVESITSTNGTANTGIATVTGTVVSVDTRYYNQYTNVLKAVDVNLEGTKILDGYNWSGETYNFSVSSDNSAPLPEKTSIEMKGTTGVSEEVTNAFGRLRFTETGTYIYTVTEEHAGEMVTVGENIIQFGSPVKITIVVEEDNNGKLVVASVTGENASWDTDSSTINATITNAPKTIEVQLKKVDENGNIKDESLFSLERFEASWINIKSEIAPGGTDETNPVDLGSLHIARYRLDETNTPPGYVKLTSYVYFEVYLDATSGELKARITDENGNVSDSTEPAFITKSNGKYIVTVINTPGQALPNTGGSGTLPYTLSGLMLIIASALMYVFRMRRRERRLN